MGQVQLEGVQAQPTLMPSVEMFVRPSNLSRNSMDRFFLALHELIPAGGRSHCISTDQSSHVALPNQGQWALKYIPGVKGPGETSGLFGKTDFFIQHVLGD